MKRILHIVGCLNMGGAENMVMNVYRQINPNKIQFDFVVAGEGRGYYEDEAEKLGANVYHITKRSQNFLNNLIDLYNVVKTNKYSAIHFHTQNAFFTTMQIIIARLAGAKYIIVHSHNTNDWRTGMALKLHYVFRPILNALTTVKLSCGEAAAKWLYGNLKNVMIIPLPIVCKNYVYSDEKYSKLRDEMGYSDTTIYAHVGRFSDVKNHDFLIDIFSEICKTTPNSVLFLMGDGELKSEIRAKVANLDLSNKVLFFGNVPDVNDKLIMADIFLFPSKYEGFPTVVLEAQAAGLRCFISNTITSNIAVTNLVKQLPLDQLSVWVEEILQKSTIADRAHYNALIKKKYDVKQTVDKLMKVYLD